MRFYLIALFCLYAAALAAAPAQENGYPLLVKAGELAKASKALDAAVQPQAVLSVKRSALSDPTLKRSLSLMRAGLALPIVKPERGSEPVFPDLALMRNLGRLLAVEQYVLLADGKVSEALDSLRDGLRLGYIVQSEMIIGSLVGVAIDAVTLRPLARRLPQLSARDCDKLFALTAEWLQAPDPIPQALATEREYALKQLETQTPPDIRDEVKAIFNREHDRLAAYLRQPAWERPEPGPINGDSTAERYAAALWETLRPSLVRAQDRWTREQAQVQLLGVHAAILRYRWEHDRLPTSLDALRLGSLATDPFTGKPFLYRTAGETTYELRSEGPLDRGQEGQPSTGERVPVYVDREGN